MLRALQLARKGSGRVSPNPLVGCVVVNRGQVVGEGYHQRYGEAHAEVHALATAGDKAGGATAYITLEPCAIEFPGKKTPACVDGLIKSGIREVVIAARDPNPKVDGSGVQRLQAAGIEVREGVLADEGRNLIRGFTCWIRTGKPYIILKGARTSDNYVAAKEPKGQWFTSEEARRRVHRLRSEVDAILVGRRTAEQDNPKLTVRETEGRNPLRVVLDTRRSLPADLEIFQDGAAATLVFTAEGKGESAPWGEYVQVDGSPAGVNLEQVLQVLGERGVTMLLVEGGPTVHRSFMQADHMDEIILFTTPVESEKEVRARDEFRNVLKIPEGWDVKEKLDLEGDQMVVARRRRLRFGKITDVVNTDHTS